MPPQAFLAAALSAPSLQCTLEPAAEPRQEIIGILAIGPAYRLDRIVAEVREWGKPLVHQTHPRGHKWEG